jgi:hypothetical protein
MHSLMWARTARVVMEYYAPLNCQPVTITEADGGFVIDARLQLFQVTARYMHGLDGSYSRVCLIHAKTAEDALIEGTRYLSINNTENAVYSVLALKRPGER